LIGKTGAVFGPEAAAIIARQDAAVLAKGGPRTEIVQWPGDTPDSEDTTLSVRFPVRDPLGAVAIGVIEVNITEHSRTQRALREKDAIMARAQRLGRFCHWTWRPSSGDDWSSGTAVYSDAAEHVFGVPPGELAVVNSDYVARFVHPEDRERVLAAYARIDHGRGDPAPITYRIVRPDGEIRTVVESVEPLQLGDAGGPRLLGTVQDITALAAAEASARASDALVRGVIDALPVCIHVKDPDGRYVLVNDHQARLLGLEKSDFIGKTARGVAPDDAYDTWLEGLEAEVWRTGRGTGFFREDQVAPGAWRHGAWLTLKTLVRDAQGTPRHLIGLGFDVTEKELALAERDRVTAALRVVGDAGLRLLAAADWRDAIPATLAELGAALGVSRAALYSAGERNGEAIAATVGEWSAPDAAPLPGDARSREALANKLLATTRPALARGEVVRAAVSTLGEPERSLLVARGTRSLVGVPVSVEGALWGVLGLCQGDRERDWSEAEVATLRALASVIGEAVRRESAERQLAHRNAVLAAVSEAVIRFLHAEDWASVLPEALSGLERVLGASRMFVYRYRRANAMDSNELVIERLAEGVRPSAEMAEEAGWALNATQFPEWERAFAAGRPIVGDAASFPDEQRRFLMAMGVLSIVDVPILVDGVPWGEFGVDQCDRRRTWTEVEIDALRAVAAAIGGAMARDRDAAALGRRDAILQVVVRAATRFLTDDGPAAIETTLAEIGAATKVGRVSLLAHDPKPPATSRLVAEWAASGVRSAKAMPEVALQGVAASGHERWIRLLARGETIHGRTSELPEAERPFLLAQDIVAIAAVPILVDGRLWGHIALDVCDEERDFPQSEIDAIRTAAAVIAAAIGRRQATREADEAQARLQAFLDHAPLGITIKDPEGRYLAANAVALANIGHTSETLIGRTTREALPQAADAIERMEREVLATGRAVQSQRSLVSDPSRQQLAIKFPIPDAEGRIAAIGTIAMDITERLRLEAQLHQAQKMEAVGQLTGGIAHDFNNLLMAVLGNLELALEGLPAGSRQRTFLEVALRAARRGADLTRRLLAFSRRQALSPQVVDVNRLIAGVADLLRRPLGADIAVELDLADLPWPAKVDPSQLETAILNLAINARDAMDAGGRLSIASRIHRFEADDARPSDLPPGDYVLVEVRDTGCGIPPDVLPRVFEPFFTTKGASKGTGLGLSMVFGFARQSGGGVEIDSTVGLGTTVRLYLPRGHESRDAARRDSGAAPRARPGETVLVVDDDDAVRDLAAAMLEALGYRALRARDGPSALGIARSADRLDLLLVDAILPGGMNGREIAAAVGALRPGVRTLFMSGYTDSVFGAPGSEAPRHLIAKPFRRADLAHHLRRALDGASVS
jgi:PAS domain S-box-containing protein